MTKEALDRAGMHPEDQGSIIPNFYIKRPVEELVFPSPDQLVTAAKKELESHFGRSFEVPEPPRDLFLTLQNFAERGIKGVDEVYYQPGLQITEYDKFWEGKGIVKPKLYFWQLIRAGHFPRGAAMLEEGWYIGDSRAKPMYEHGQQRYGKDDYLEPLMTYLRSTNKIQKYSEVPEYSRFGASPREIEQIISPVFSKMGGAKGIVRNRRYMEFNIRGNIAHPEYGQTNTWELFDDPVFWSGVDRLVCVDSGHGSLADVDIMFDAARNDRAGFSLLVAFPSKP